MQDFLNGVCTHMIWLTEKKLTYYSGMQRSACSSFEAQFKICVLWFSGCCVLYAEKYGCKKVVSSHQSGFHDVILRANLLVQEITTRSRRR